jgi:hypothetical protein
MAGFARGKGVIVNGKALGLKENPDVRTVYLDPVPTPYYIGQCRATL